uniref:NADH dehydrogenase [ubiquinone] 1 alpha subcomplex assembly factor 4 n=1 Tax=Cyprinodon variegatus TaxID=28743 RepID=A0A3Q2FK02_CYPVA
MGGRLARMFRNFNVENRALREISKDKPRAAPRYPDRAPPPSVSAEGERLGGLCNRRGHVLASPGFWTLTGFIGVQPYLKLSDVPKGKLTIAEALKALGSHQHQPQTWTAEKIAQEYSLDLKETKSLMEFFIPFKVEIIPPKTRTAKQIKAS